LFLFKRIIYNRIFFDYKLCSSNIKIFCISEEKPAYVKYFYAHKFVARIYPILNSCDFLLLRGPSPMNYAFTKKFDREKITNLVVGDYSAGIKFIKQPFFRSGPIKLLNYLMDLSYVKSIQGTNICCNSEVLHEKYKSIAKKSAIITTGIIHLTDISINPRAELKSKQNIKILYVGRIDWAKGFKEMLDCIKKLNFTDKKTYELHIVGWDDSKGEINLKSVLELAKILNVSSKVFFHGKKKPGPELNSFYRNCDIFVLASYQEGFPRTIWEAFCNGIPIVTTPVGGIPYKLKNFENALFINVKDSDSLRDAIQNIVNDSNLANNLVQNGAELVKENTIENQIIKLKGIILNG
jgi:glycosyltransferase involved in cell wall biosynthesis